LKTILLMVKGHPRPQPRHQVTRTGRAFIPAKHWIHKWKDQIREATCGNMVPSDELCEVTLKFHIPIPKTRRKADGSATSKLTPTCRYDIDNLSKAVLDCLQGEDCVLVDDRQVVKLIASKAWTECETGGCEIKVKFL
jgi:Holliday junction resolvase RusA-like endonuclease